MRFKFLLLIPFCLILCSCGSSDEVALNEVGTYDPLMGEEASVDITDADALTSGDADSDISGGAGDVDNGTSRDTGDADSDISGGAGDVDNGTSRDTGDVYSSTSGDSGNDASGNNGNGTTVNAGDNKSGDDGAYNGQEETIYVYVCGEVRVPGVYAGSVDSRIWQMIDLAGGLTENAADNAINQAEYCYDGQMIYVPTDEEFESDEWRAEAKARADPYAATISPAVSVAGSVTGSTTGTSPGSVTGSTTGAGTGSVTGSTAGSTSLTSPGSDAGNDDGLININTADSATLQEISGIGAGRAADIITYREKNGAFYRIEDIMKVPGIKEGMFSKIKDRIKV